MEFRKFSSIEQFRNVIKSVGDYTKHRGLPLPTLTFKGTVKLHGTNAGIVYNAKTKDIHFQSRENIITPQKDNAGFATWASGSYEVLDLIDLIIDENPDVELIHIYGEWAGPGIQKGVGISGLENKKFFVFSILVDGKEIFEDFNFGYNRIWDLKEFDTYTIAIDFNRPDNSQNKLVELTLSVEEQCPVARYFGLTGIGEGIVWKNYETGLTFKVKGEKHSVTKVKTVKEIAAVDIEKFNQLNDFAEAACSENRLKQGIDKLRELGFDPLDNKNTGEFIKWVAGDIFKEEIDTITANEFDTKKLGGVISRKAREFYLGYSE